MLNSRLGTFRAIGSGLLIGIGGLLLALIITLLAGVVPTFLGYESYVVYSGSMEPAIHVGDLAIVGPIRPDQLTVGDVLTYRLPDRPETVVTHRLIKIETSDPNLLAFETKGDANNVADRVLVAPGAVLGRVAYTIPRIGYLVDFAKRTEGRLILLGGPGLILAVDYLLGARHRRIASGSLDRVNDLSAHS